MRWLSGAGPSGLFRSDDAEVVAGEVDWMGWLADETGLATTFILLQLTVPTAVADLPAGGARAHGRRAMRSISTWEPSGSAATPMVVRAG